MLRVLIDESFNQRILRGLNRRYPKLDYVIAQRSALKGAMDSVILAWASDHDRIVITHDLSTLPLEAYKRVRANEPMPGLIAVPHDVPIGKAIEDLLIVIECSSADEIRNRVFYIPI